MLGEAAAPGLPLRMIEDDFGVLQNGDVIMCLEPFACLLHFYRVLYLRKIRFTLLRHEYGILSYKDLHGQINL